MVEWETILDPVEQAFTVSMPRGWRNRAWLERRGAAVYNLAVAESPDGATTLFLGDSGIPSFVEPGAFPFGAPPGAVVRPFTSIEHLLPSYAGERFGRRPGFRVLHMAPSPELFRIVMDSAVRSGAPSAWVTAGRLAFELEGGEAPIRGLLFGSSVRLGPIWWADMHVLTTTGDPEAHAPLLLSMLGSRKVTPAMHQRQMEERARSAANHRATMASLETNAAILRSNHQANTATLASMVDAHQRRMDDLHQVHDAANAAWSERQRAEDAVRGAARDAGDDDHRRFLNLIAEERTVVDASGETYQVADGYDRYFRRRSDGAWIGTREHHDLRGMPGINPDDFDELKIKR